MAKMTWDKLLTEQRIGKDDINKLKASDIRSPFERDFDRIIFSASFRRLQNKTQVFPLPGSVFVHNRLTHSLEVASVGRSLGSMLAEKLIEQGEHAPNVKHIGSIVAAACLTHDLGNPPFGHGGEKAISSYFRSQERRLKEYFTPEEWRDFCHFEGNANSLRFLTHDFRGKRKGGFAITAATAAAMIKYPYSSSEMGNKKKYGFFSSEKKLFLEIAEKTGMLKRGEGDVSTYARHPLVFLVEAADDICYQVMDIEDAHRLSILDYETVEELLSSFFQAGESDPYLREKERVFREVSDRNERIAYLRSGVITRLINETLDIFLEQKEAILAGEYTKNLLDSLRGNSAEAMAKCKKTAKEVLYNHTSVVDIIISGHKIISSLLDFFITAVLNEDDSYSHSLLSTLPMQHRPFPDNEYSEKIRCVVDYVSGMTDVYALDRYRKLQGMEITGL